MEEQSRSSAGRYRSDLRSVIGSSAAPYGYTLAVWTTGGALSHYHGQPTAFATFSFMAGAVLAFALVGTLAFGGVTPQFDPRPNRTALWGTFHFISVGVAIAVALLVSNLVRSGLAWPLAAFLSTAIYLLIVAAEHSVARD